MVSGRGSVLLEELAPLLQGSQVGAIRRNLVTSCLTQQTDLFGIAGLNIDHSIRAEGRDHAPGPARGANLAMRFQRSGRGIGCGQHLDLETLKEPPGLKRWRAQLRLDGVVNALSVHRIHWLRDTKDLAQFVAQPQAGGRAAKEIPVIADQLPDFAMILLYWLAIPARNAQRF